MTPSYEHTTGEDLVRQEVDEGKQLEMAKADAENFFHTFRTIEELQQYFGCGRCRLRRWLGTVSWFLRMRSTA